MTENSKERVRSESALPLDPLGPALADKRPWWRWPVDTAAVALLLLGSVWVLSHMPEVETSGPEDRVLDFIPIESPPAEDIPVATEPPDEEAPGEELPIEEPEPEVPEPPAPDPEPTPPEPTPPRETPPAQPPQPLDLPEGNPRPLQEDERPIRIGLEAQSFDESGASDGPTFAVGDTARGGRPSTRSADERRAVAGASETGTGDEPARESARPEARPQRGRGGTGTTRAALQRGVSRTVPYPSSARDRGVESTCTARIKIGDDGTVQDVSSVSCDEAGYGFEEALERHIRANFRFDPERVDGVAQPTEIRWRHDFRIDN